MRFIAFLAILVLVGCQREKKASLVGSDQIYQSDFKTVINDAKGFEITQSDSMSVLKVKSLSPKYPFKDSLVLMKSQNHIDAKTWQSNWQKFACQSSTHLTFLNALGRIEMVKGLVGIDFMPKDHVYQTIRESGVLELSKNGNIDMERLVNLNIDLFLIYPFELDESKYENANVKTLLVSEYLEQTVIARLEWIKFFGVLVGAEEKAHQIFETIKHNYHQLKNPRALNKTVFFNLPFKDTWHMPAPNSITTNLVKDAGFSYLYDDNDIRRDNMLFPKEKVWEKAYEADYWIIIANRPENYSLADLLEEESVYKTFKSVKSNQVIFCNTSHSSYFTEGILEPDVMLKDLLFLTKQISDHEPKYFKLLK